MSADYDRLYDMALYGQRVRAGIAYLNSRQDNTMRGTGVEPASPKAPDPKSHSSPEKLTPGTGPGVTTAAQRRTAPETAAWTTTDTTTRAESAPLSSIAALLPYSADPLLAQPARMGGGE